jgi:hypothetical protein
MTDKCEHCGHEKEMTTTITTGEMSFRFARACARCEASPDFKDWRASQLPKYVSHEIEGDVDPVAMSIFTGKLDPRLGYARAITPEDISAIMKKMFED